MQNKFLLKEYNDGIQILTVGKWRLKYIYKTKDAK